MRKSGTAGSEESVLHVPQFTVRHRDRKTKGENVCGSLEAARFRRSVEMAASPWRISRESRMIMIDGIAIYVTSFGIGIPVSCSLRSFAVLSNEDLSLPVSSGPGQSVFLCVHDTPFLISGPFPCIIPQYFSVKYSILCKIVICFQEGRTFAFHCKYNVPGFSHIIGTIF